MFLSFLGWWGRCVLTPGPPFVHLKPVTENLVLVDSRSFGASTYTYTEYSVYKEPKVFHKSFFC